MSLFALLFSAVICPSLNLTNGEIFYHKSGVDGGYELETVAQIVCHPGYNRSGDLNIVCEISGSWSEQKPTCNQSN